MTEEKKTYNDFKEFYDRHPSMDNAEYYTEFPTVHKSTLRSWKVKANKVETPVAAAPTPAATTVEKTTWDAEMVKLLCTQTGTKLSDFENVDTKSALLILKNKLSGQQREAASKPDKPRSSNAPILPLPNPIGQNKKKFGIDPYITFDEVKNEIRIEAPMDVFMDPEKNKALGEHD